LVQAAIQTASLKSEKETLEKKKSTTGGLLQKAKAHSSFPSTAAFFQQTWNDEGGHLANVDRALGEHRSSYNQLEGALKKNWVSSLNSGFNTEEKVNELKQEIEATKQNAKQSKDEASNLREYSHSLEEKLTTLQVRMTMLEKSLENHSTTLNNQNRAQCARLDSVSSEIEKRVEGVSIKLEESMTTKFKTEGGEWQKQRAALDTEIQALRSSQESFLAAIHNVNQTVEEQQQKVTDIESLGQRLNDFDTRLASFESARTTSGSTAGNASNLDRASALQLQSRIQNLEDILKELQSLQQMKDDFHFSEVDDLKKVLEQASEELKSVKINHDKLSDEVKGLHDTHPAAALQQIARMSESLQTTQQAVDSIKVGLYSLETRYNNLTTEPIVRNMVAAMHEMYPSNSQLVDQVGLLGAKIEKETAALKGDLDNVWQNQAAFIRQTQQEAALRLDELNKLRNDHTSLSQTLTPLWEQYSAKTQSPSHEDLYKLQAEYNTLSTKFEEYISKHDSHLKSRKESDDLFMEGLRDERDRLTSRVSQLASSLEKLANDVEEVKSINTSSLAKVEAHADDIGSLRDGISELGKTTSAQHQAFLDKLTDIRQDHSTHGTEISSLLERLGELERYEKLRHKELHEQLDELKKAVEAKEFLPRAASPIFIGGQAPISTDNGPASPEEAARILNVAETNPTRALREKTKKKKRPRPSGLSEDERSPTTRPESPRSFSSAASPFGAEETPTENAKRPKKKKKRKMVTTEPIPLD
jgi:chromosome segregation ATPase